MKNTVNPLLFAFCCLFSITAMADSQLILCADAPVSDSIPCVSTPILEVFLQAEEVTFEDGTVDEILQASVHCWLISDAFWYSQEVTYVVKKVVNSEENTFQETGRFIQRVEKDQVQCREEIVLDAAGVYTVDVYIGDKWVSAAVVQVLPAK